MNNYIILNKISSGEFGSVVKAQHKYTKQNIAIKIESNIHNTLRYESEIYNYLNTVPNIPKLKGYFVDDHNHYLVQELLDYNLTHYKRNIISQTPPLIDKLNIICKLLKILHNIHSMGIIHRDIKPENICFKNEQLFLIDFGLAKKIIHNNNHIEIKTSKSLIGTPNYVSLNVVNGIEPSRRDDIESLIYILIYLFLDDNAIHNYNNLNIDKKKNIEIIMDILSLSHIHEDIKNLVNTYLTYCRNMHFDVTPDYNYLNLLLNKTITDISMI